MRKDREYTEAVEETVAENPKKDKNTVHINIPNLAIRKGPGTDFDKTWKVIGDTDVRLEKVVVGVGAKKGWGKLLDIEGWINLDFTDYEE